VDIGFEGIPYVLWPRPVRILVQRGAFKKINFAMERQQKTRIKFDD
jgi:hypothetical protein